LREKLSHPLYKPPLLFVLRLRLQKGGRICRTLRYAINVVYRIFVETVDYGAVGTRHALAILRALTTLLFGNRKCPAPRCT